MTPGLIVPMWVALSAERRTRPWMFWNGWQRRSGLGLRSCLRSHGKAHHHRNRCQVGVGHHARNGLGRGIRAK
jgi:hypothetical protein